jgi:hypothetical protein
MAVVGTPVFFERPLLNMLSEMRLVLSLILMFCFIFVPTDPTVYHMCRSKKSYENREKYTIQKYKIDAKFDYYFLK